MSNRAPGTVWTLRMGEMSPYVRTEHGDLIAITVPRYDMHSATLYISRKDARLLAKRINQCLDATVKK